MEKSRPEFVKYRKYGTFTSLGNVSSLGRNIQRDLHVFEKLDGGNCQVRRDGWRILPGSKSAYLTGKKLDEHPWFRKFTGWAYSNPSLFNLPDDVILFGEWLGNHTIEYLRENEDKFYVLDVLDLNAKRFIPYEIARQFLVDRGIEDVSFLDIKAKGRVSSSDIEKILFEQSDYYSGEKEGVVIKCYDSPQAFFRLYHPEHSEVGDLSGGNPLAPSRFSRAIYRIMDRTCLPKVGFNEIVDEVIRDVVRDGNDLPNKRNVERALGRYMKNRALRGADEHIS